MELKLGYKRTEVGVIPVEWGCTTVRDVASRARNAIVGGPFGSNLVSRDYVEVGVPVIRGQNMSGKWVSGNFAFVSIAKARSLEANLARPGDIVFTQRGTLGQVTIVPEAPFQSYLVSQSQMKLSVNRAIADPLFLFYVFTSEEQQEVIRGGTIQTGVPHINLGILRDIQVQLPPLPEQHAIAKALSDVDALIGALDQLVVKKRDLKQAAMQQLLTGQTRLPSFHGEWEVKRLNGLAEIRSGGTPSTTEPSYWDGEVPWCTPTDITALKGHKYLCATSRAITQRGLKASSAEMIPPNSIVMTSRATIGECAINTVPISTNQGFKNFVPFATTDTNFLYYLLATQKQGFISLCGGSTFLEIGKAQLVAYQVRLPGSKLEQAAIAEVLSDMDAELAALERRRDKTRALKQGMMQELLTGRTRLV
ncbi:MAG: restriction endonuclease subunit S [Planctomycetota bacterium]